MFRLDRKFSAAVAVAAAVIITSAGAYGAYAVGGADPRPDVAGRTGDATTHSASLQSRCGTPVQGTRCEPPAWEAELTCEEALACATATVEPELTCEQANACATPETECHGDVCFTPPVPPLCPPNARCIAPPVGVYSCVREAHGIACTMPIVDPIPPCPLMPPVDGDGAPPTEPACPPPCGAPVPMPGGDAQPQAMPSCPPPCLDTPAPAPSTGNEPQTFVPACQPPCGMPVPTPGGDTPAPAPSGGAEPQTFAPECMPPCGETPQAEPDAGPGGVPSCPEPLPPDCVISSDGAVACPGSSPPSGTGAGSSGVATAVPGIVGPTTPEYAPD